MNKEEEIAGIRSGDIKFAELTAEDVTVFVHGDTAIATGIAVYRGSFKGRPFDGRDSFFDVYQKRKGTWRVIACCSTSIPEQRKS